MRQCLPLILCAFAVAGCSNLGPVSPGKGAGPGGARADKEDAAKVSTSPARRGGAGDEASLPARQNIYFDFDSATLSEASRRLLAGYVRPLTRGNVRLRVEGHTDERGTSEYNLALGKLRAESVLSWLRIKGAPAGRMESVSFGEENPADPGHDESAWKKNRRAEIILK